jgi:hypothetical protein
MEWRWDMQGRDGWGWGALTKGGRGVRKEEEEERKKQDEESELIPCDRPDPEK